ncbi:SH3 domain-binding protein 5-like [Lingula anatina]|uniref:SH3 domain-binding protein 5-like n=1 Tax=Lingula anatina TaxID=7574 RepID=A0A1S3K616_LINAN|nr:SH3 domain-binding protein 5-like [Lingula anatina]|eukprot:XP_013417874.1 SH3 domain-binding protein 5-like [Lingula anatina]
MEEFEGSTESDEQEEPIDPRIQEELEKLNTATDEINKLETELDEARARFRSTLNESGHRLTQLYRKYKRNVDKARPYYDARREAEQAQEETHRAAREFQRANSLYKAAKETIQLAEQRLLDADPSEKREFDSAWQEMLNHATMRVMESEQEKGKSEMEHHKKASFYEAAQHKVLLLEKKFKRAISNSKPYYAVKLDLEKQLEQQKIDVEDLQRAISAAKHKYSAALKNLERISEEVHLRRKSRVGQFKLPPREPGVGAESVSSESSLPEVNLDKLEKGSYAGGLSDDDDIESVDSRDNGLEDSLELKPRSFSKDSDKNVTFSTDQEEIDADLDHTLHQGAVEDVHSKMIPSETRASMGDGSSETEQPDAVLPTSSILLNDNVDNFVPPEPSTEVHHHQHHHHHHHHHHMDQSHLALPPSGGGASHPHNRHSSHEQRRHSLQPPDIVAATKRRANSVLVMPGHSESLLEPGAPVSRERRTSKVTQGLAHLNVNDLLLQHAQSEGQS